MNIPTWEKCDRILRLALLLLGCCLPPAIFAAPLAVTGLDLSNAHTGGPYRLFLSIPGAKSDLSAQDLLLSVNQQWQTPESLQLRSPQRALDLALLVESTLLQAPESAAALASAFQAIQTQGMEADRIRLTTNGTAFTKDWPEQGEASPEGPDAAASLQALHATLEQGEDGSRMVVLWFSNGSEQEFPEEDWHHLQNLLIRKQTTLFVFSDTPSSPEGRSAVAANGGRFLSAQPAEAALQATAARIFEEYEVTFQSQGLGWIPQTLEIRTLLDSETHSTTLQIPRRHVWQTSKEGGWVYGLGSLILAGLLLLLVFRLKSPRSPAASDPYFVLVSPKVPLQKVTIPEANTAMSFLETLAAKEKLRLPGNVSRVWLKRDGENLLLEDNNYKNALLVNRRRTKRRVLQHDDLLDMGEVVLRFADPQSSRPSTSPSAFSNADFQYKEPPKPLGPLRKDLLTLTISGRKATFPLTKNLFFIGESQMNDLVIKGEDTHSKHAKIQKVGSTYKLVNLATADVTQVNGRRISQKFLREGDAIQLGNVRIQASFGTPPKARPPQPPKKPYRGKN